VKTFSLYLVDNKKIKISRGGSRGYFKTLQFLHSGESKVHTESTIGESNSGQARITGFEMTSSKS